MKVYLVFCSNNPKRFILWNEINVSAVIGKVLFFLCSGSYFIIAIFSNVIFNTAVRFENYISFLCSSFWYNLSHFTHIQCSKALNGCVDCLWLVCAHIDVTNSSTNGLETQCVCVWTVSVSHSDYPTAANSKHLCVFLYVFMSHFLQAFPVICLMTACNVIGLTRAELKKVHGVLISLAEGNHCVYLFCASLSWGLIDRLIEHGFGFLYLSSAAQSYR